jgi:DNA-binding response OmpR family regulator
VHVSRLRQALDGGSGKTLIHTVRGSGYVLEERD